MALLEQHIPSKLSYTSPLPEMHEMAYENMLMITVTYNGIVKLLSNLKNKSAGGPGNILSQVIKACSQEMAYFLVVLFKSFHTYSIPA